jgi:hypothetical protein
MTVKSKIGYDFTMKPEKNKARTPVQNNSWLNAELPLGISLLLRSAESILLTVIIFCLFIPLNPVMPSAGLDPSWSLAINQALSDGLIFGKNLIFTFGPYSSIYTKLYHPDTSGLILVGSALLAAGYASMLLALQHRSKPVWRLCCIILFAGFMGSRDALLFSYPLLAVFYSYRILNSPNRNSPCSIFFIPFCFLPMGLLPLIKSSLFILVLPVTGLTTLLFLLHKKLNVALSTALAPIGGFIIFWYVAGQPIAALPGYLEKTFAIISGYSPAMAYTSQADILDFILQLGAFLLTAVTLLWALSTIRSGFSSKLILLATLCLYLFSTMKAGFIRHDNQHALIAGNSLLLAAVLTALLVNTGRLLVVANLMAVAACFYIGGLYILNDVYADTREGFQLRHNATGLDSAYEHSLSVISEHHPLPLLDGKSDIYSFEQAILIASHNHWSPRPVLQSYSSYNHFLADMDANYLRSQDRPENIFFNLETIDNRFPTEDTGKSLIALFEHYTITRLLDNGKYILFFHTPAPIDLPRNSLSAYTASRQKNIELPEVHEPVYLELQLHPTWLGNLATLLLNPPPVQATFLLTDGSTRNFRIIPAMAESGFLVSPLVESNRELALLTQDPGYLAAKHVKSLSLSFPYHGEYFWKTDVSIHLSTVDFRNYPASSIPQLFDEPDTHIANQLPSLTADCKGKLDLLDGNPVTSSNNLVSGTVSIFGRADIASQTDNPASEIYVVLLSPDNKPLYVKAHMIPIQQLGYSNFGNYGYFVYMDTLHLSGNYTLMLAIKSGEVLLQCNQPEAHIMFHPVSP